MFGFGKKIEKVQRYKILYHTKCFKILLTHVKSSFQFYLKICVFVPFVPIFWFEQIDCT